MATRLHMRAVVLVLALAARLPAQGVEARTPHFRVLGEPDTAPVAAATLERLHSQLRALGFPIPEGSTEVALFSTAAEMRPFAPPGLAAGFFQQGTDASFLAVAWDAGEPLRALQHEFAHRVLQPRLLGRPDWLREGLAELLSNLQPAPGAVILGAPIAGHLETLKSGRDDGMLFYARSWAAVHRLLVAQSAGLTLAARIDALPASPEQDPSLPANLPVELVPMPPLPEAEARVRPLHPWERDHQRAELLRARNLNIQARAALVVLRSQFPDRPEAFGSLGAMEMDAFQYTEAETLLAEAIRRGSTSPSTHYRYSLLQMRPGGSQEDAVRHARRAVELDPSQPLYWLARAQAEMQAAEWQSARASLEEMRRRTADPMLLDQVRIELAEVERRREQALRPPAISQPPPQAANVPVAPAVQPPPPDLSLPPSEPWRWPPIGTVLFIGQVRQVECTAEAKILTVSNLRFTVRVRERRGQPAKVYYAPRALQGLPCSLKNVSVNVVYRPFAGFGPLNGDLVAVLF
jgi:tetratricopeptide (TPR) repeat protein